MTLQATPSALITCGSVSNRLAPGQTLTFGRGRDHHLRIGHEPEDRQVSRYAGRLECRADGVLVQNTSSKRTILAKTFGGPVLEIPPLMLIGTTPHPMVQLVIIGGTGSSYAINIDTRALTTSANVGDWAAGFGQPATKGYVRIDDLSLRERLLLTALCLPVPDDLAEPGDVPTYRQLEQLLRQRGYPLSHKTIRHGLDALRAKLAVTFEVPGIYAGEKDGGHGGKQSFLPALARWARASNNVTVEELDGLDAGVDG